MKNFFIVMMIMFGLMVFSGQVNAEELCGETIYPDIQSPHPYGKAQKGTQVWSHTIHKTGAGWLKVHFKDFYLNGNDYVELIDMTGQVIETIKGIDVQNDETSKFKVIPGVGRRVSFWAPAIDGNELTIKLHRVSNSRRGWGFAIDEVGVGFEPMDDGYEIESICGTNDLVNIKCKDTATQNLGLRVGRMYFQKSGSWYLCTGFLVSSCSAHFLTNEHCISDQTVTSTLQVRFKYRYTTCTGTTLDSYSTYYGDKWIKDSVSYDYCLLTLKNNPQNTYGYLQLINGAPITGETIYIIQHPGGSPQKYSTSTVYNTTANSGKDLAYMADTEGGSSGSPVFADTEDQVLGLHHYGGCPNSAVKMDLIYEGIIGYICQ